MENIANNNEQKQPDIQEENANETDCHIRNLILNANITITATAPQQKIQNQLDENKEENNNSINQEILNHVNGMTPTKKQKLSIDVYEGTTPPNPLASLPLSLISNGTLSVTSDSACVAIENGIPILKEACSSDRQANIPLATLTPVLEIVSTKNVSSSIQHSAVEKLQPKNINIDSSKDASKCNDSKKGSSKYAINNIICKALTDVVQKTPFGKIGLIPNPNQMDFLTLLGLEIVVDSCCSNEVPKYKESFHNKTPLFCGQCHADFTKNWHFYKSPLQVVCDNCFTFNEHQILKAKQTVRLAKEYTMSFHQKQRTEKIQFKFKEINKSRTIKTDCLLSTRLSTQQVQNQLFENYMNAAGIFTKGNDSVSDLTRLGASIASNSEVFEAAKAVNSLDSSATPLSRAKAVQNFQISLFKGLHEKLSSKDSNDLKIQKQPLFHYQMTVAQMVKQANITSLQSENQIVETPLNGIVRAIKAQHQSLVKTILQQVPNLTNHGVQDQNLINDF